MKTRQRHLLSAYFTQEEWEALTSLCADEERSIASLVGRIIRAYLAESGALKVEEESDGRCD